MQGTENVFLVTIKLPKNPDHDPKNKVTGACPVSFTCTDSTGEHHTTLVHTEEEVQQLRDNGNHITRVETLTL